MFLWIVLRSTWANSPLDPESGTYQIALSKDHAGAVTLLIAIKNWNDFSNRAVQFQLKRVVCARAIDQTLPRDQVRKVFKKKKSTDYNTPVAYGLAMNPVVDNYKNSDKLLEKC